MLARWERTLADALRHNTVAYIRRIVRKKGEEEEGDEDGGNAKGELKGGREIISIQYFIFVLHITSD
jgi:hypothetical protein